jgi:multidrug resistance efflux pump
MNPKRSYRPALTCLSVLSITACLAGLWWSGRPAREDTSAAPAEPDGIPCVGRVDVEPGVAKLSALRPGRIAAVLVGDNQAVTAGAVLVQLEDVPERLLLAQAQAALDEAGKKLEAVEKLPGQHQARVAQQEAALEAARARLAAARLQADRLDQQWRKTVGSKDEAEAAAWQAKALEAALRAEEARLRELLFTDPAVEVARARAEVAARQAQCGLAQDALRGCQVMAPGPGTVLRVLASPGDVVSPQTGMPLVYYCPAGPRIIRAEVDQEFAGEVAVGQEVLLQDDAGGSVPRRGKVLRVSDWCTRRRSILQDPLQVTDARTLECIIRPEPEQPLRIGQEVRLKILTGPARQ